MKFFSNITPKSRYIIFVTILGVIFLGFIECLQYCMGLYLERRGWIYNSNVTENYDSYLDRLNPLLGWPSPNLVGHHDFDEVGSRKIPAFLDPNKNKSLISIYGDSFAWSAEVDNDHALSNVLSNELHSRVANYGIVGYGTDQAYLRFLYNKFDDAKNIIMVFSTDNIRRNVNQFRNLIVPSPQFGIKPRFISDQNGQLKLIPIPALTKKDYENLIENPGQYLKYDFFTPGGLSHVQKLQFPYFFCLFKLVKPLFSQIIFGELPYDKFYRSDHPSGALQITTEILKNFSREAEKRGKKSLVVIVPLLWDILRFKKTNEWIYRTLIHNLNMNNIKFIDAGPGIISYLGKRSPDEILAPGRHFNEEGYRLLAKIIFDYMASNYHPIFE